MLSLSVVLSASALLAGQAAAACTRELLGDVASKFIKSASTDGITFKTGSNLKYTENYKDVNLANGVYSKAIEIAHTRTLLDGPACGIYVEIIAPNNKPGYQLATQVFVNEDGAANKVEVIVTSSAPDSNSWFYNGTRALDVIQKQEASQQRGVIPEAQRASRERLKGVADAYFSVFGGGPRKIPNFSKSCLRQEGGFQRQLNCSMGAGSQPKGTAPTCGTTTPIAPQKDIRGYIIDETVGSVEVFAKFMDAPDSHDFRIEGCEVVLVHAITTTFSSGSAAASSAQAKMSGPKSTGAAKTNIVTA